MKKKINKKEKKSFSQIMLRLGTFCIMAYLASTLVFTQVEIMVKKQELEAVKLTLARQLQDNEELQRLIASGDEADYIERIAREKLGYAAPGERVFIDISGK